MRHKVRHGGGLVILWGCFASSCTGNLQCVEGKMDSFTYHDILRKNMKALNNSYLNCSSHKSWILC